MSDILDYLCSVAIPRPVFFLWRPALPNPKDDMVLELAVEPIAPSERLLCGAIHLSRQFKWRESPDRATIRGVTAVTTRASRAGGARRDRAEVVIGGDGVHLLGDEDRIRSGGLPPGAAPPSEPPKRDGGRFQKRDAARPTAR